MFSLSWKKLKLSFDATDLEIVVICPPLLPTRFQNYPPDGALPQKQLLDGNMHSMTTVPHSFMLKKHGFSMVWECALPPRLLVLAVLEHAGALAQAGLTLYMQNKTNCRVNSRKVSNRLVFELMSVTVLKFRKIFRYSNITSNGAKPLIRFVVLLSTKILGLLKRSDIIFQEY